MAGEVLKRHGIDPEELKRRGGALLEGFPRLDPRLEPSRVQANAFFKEGGGRDSYENALPGLKLVYLSIEPKIAREFEEEFGWKSVTLPPNYFSGQDEPLVVLDFSDWILCVRADMDEKLAYRLAQLVWERREELQSKALWSDRIYASSPVSSGLIDPGKAVTTPIPLHPGAARYYQEAGLLSK